MLAEKITYTDFDDVERTETAYFNLTKSELAIMSNSTSGGFRNKLQKMIDSKNSPEILDTFLEIMKTAYGVKSDDGRRLIKNDAVWTDFKETLAFDKLFMKLTTSDEEMLAFVKGILPSDLAEEIKMPVPANDTEKTKAPLPAKDVG